MNPQKNSRHINTEDTLKTVLSESVIDEQQRAEIQGALGQGQQAGWWQKLSLQVKATVMAIAIGAIPVLAVGGIAYSVTNQEIKLQITDNAATEVVDLEEKLALFVGERYADIQVLAQLDIFTNSKIRATLTRQEKEATLNLYIKDYGFYDSIAVFDRQGNVLAQSQGKPLDNPRNQKYFQTVLETNRPFISEPQVSQSSGISNFYIAAPIKDKATGKTIAVLRARIPITSVKELFDEYSQEGKDFYLIDSTNTIFASGNQESIGQTLEKQFPKLFAQVEEKQGQESAIARDYVGGREYLLAYASSEILPEKYKLNWQMVVGNSTNLVFAPQRQLLLTLLLGTGVTAMLVGAVATNIAERATGPILAAADAVEKIGQGEWDTRLVVEGQDEVATLGYNINLMSEQIETLLAEKAEIAKQQAEAAAEIAKQQAEDAEQVRQRQKSEALQRELNKLLHDVEGAASGDLTVRAEISGGEIGIVADFFNSIIESLRGIVVQVKQAASQVNISVGKNEGAIRQLADEALKQATDISQTLNSVEEMTLSIQEVADNARIAAEVARAASARAQTGGAAMDRTVESILQLRSTVAETAKKVKRLGESSQQISQVVSLINEIALKTNLLAVNASIEAARAGEEGRGFAVVAEEVGELAEQSAAATREIENIVSNIQRGTSEVVHAMELGTAQVVEGTHLVEETKQSLEEMVEGSHQIDKLFQSISSATVSQVQTSQVVRKLMGEIAQVSERTSNSSGKVSNSLQQTVEIAQELQASVGTFKVEGEK
ncbi:MAG: methyl-accepting chemotaxis protein [Xenococcaceae cyanobacterium]